MPGNYFFRNGGYIGVRGLTSNNEGDTDKSANGIWTIVEQQIRNGSNLWPVVVFPRVSSFTYVGANTNANTTVANTNQTIGNAGTPAAGDLAIIAFTVDAAPVVTFTTPSGWSVAGYANTGTGSAAGAVFYKLLTSADLTTNSVPMRSNGGASPCRSGIIIFRPTILGTTNTTPAITVNDFEANTSASAIGTFTVNTTLTSTATNSVIALTQTCGRPLSSPQNPTLTMTPNDATVNLGGNMTFGYNIFNRNEALSDISYSCTDAGQQNLLGFYLTFAVT